MKLRLFLLALMGWTAWGASFTVIAAGGGNFTTIQACANAMVNAGGDTCTVFAGTYPENVTVPAGGVGAYKILTVNSSDVVTVQSFTLSSHDKVIGNCAVGAAINTCGFNIQNPANPSNHACISIGASQTDIFVQSNVMYACNNFLNEPPGAYTTFVYFLNNTMSWSQTTSALLDPGLGVQTIGDHHFFEGNDMSEVSDGWYSFGQFLVWRNNKFHDMTVCNTAGHGSNCHIDFSQHEGSLPGGLQGPTNRLLFESNQVFNMTNNGGIQPHAGSLFQTDNGCNGSTPYFCHTAIRRFDQVWNNASGATTDDGAPGWIDVKQYNNTYAHDCYGDLSAGCAINPRGLSSGGGANLNEIYYFVGTPSGVTPYYCYGSNGCTGNTGLPAGTPPAPAFNFGHNLGFATGGGTIGGASLSGGEGASWTSNAGNVLADPLFVNFAANNFNLSAGSPAIGHGTNLTTAVGAGTSSTILTVTDAGYFQDGWGYPAGTGLGQMSPDWLRIGASTTVQIAAGGVNYVTATITLASAVSWNNGDPVYLFKKSDGAQVLSGALPDMGALPFTPSTGAPSITTSSPLPNGTVGVAYSQNIAATGTSPITWTVAAGALPSWATGCTGTVGLTCTISGTPNAAATSNFTLQAANGIAPNAQQAFALQVLAVPPSITTACPLPSGTVGVVYPAQNMTATGTPPITWDLSLGIFPSGITMTTGGVVSGTPNGTPGQSNFTLRATNSAGNNTLSCSLTVQAPPAPIVTLNFTFHDFGNQVVATQSAGWPFTITNTGNAVLAITGISESNAADFTDTSDCPISPATLAIGAFCTVTNNFSPTIAGIRTGNVVISDNAANTPQNVAVQGTGQAALTGNVSTGVVQGAIIQ